MPQVRGNPAGKWVSRTQQAVPEYEDGVRNPRRDWQQATEAAAPVQAAAVQAAIRDGRYQKGVRKAGSGKWQSNTLAKGAQRFAQGVQAGESEYEKGVAPYLDVIEKTQLPPRGPKGDPNNINRVIAINKALHEAKVKGV